MHGNDAERNELPTREPAMCQTAAAKKNPNRGANGNQGSKWITKERRFAIYLRDGFGCAYCGRDLRDARPAEITLDHLDTRADLDKRRSAGLPLHPTNRLVTACLKCNSGRQDKPWREFATPGAVARIVRQVRRKLNMDMARALLAGRATNPDVEAR